MFVENIVVLVQIIRNIFLQFSTLKFKTLNKNNLIFCPTFWGQYQLIMSKNAS